MNSILKKLLSVILSAGIILSSAGFTILNHFCKLEQTNYVSIAEFYKQECTHTENHLSCCEEIYNSCCSSKVNIDKSLSYKSFDDCCTDQKFFSKIEVATNEKSLKKFSDVYKISLKVDYIKNSIKENFNNKFEQFKINFINPIKKLIRLIHIISKFIPSDKSETPH